MPGAFASLELEDKGEAGMAGMLTETRFDGRRAHTRVTTVAKALDDREAIMKWREAGQ